MERPGQTQPRSNVYPTGRYTTAVVKNADHLQGSRTATAAGVLQRASEPTAEPRGRGVACESLTEQLVQKDNTTKCARCLQVKQTSYRVYTDVIDMTYAPPALTKPADWDSGLCRFDLILQAQLVRVALAEESPDLSDRELSHAGGT